MNFSKKIISMMILLFCSMIFLTVNTCDASDALLRKLSKQRPRTLVNDYAGILSRSQKNALEGLLVELSNKTGAQVAIVVINSLDGGDINDFATRLYENWGIGKRGKDEGLLFLIALKDKKVRIEVGYGLEGIFPDAKTGRILDNYVVPSFRKNNYANGIVNGTYNIVEIIASDAGISLTGGKPVVRRTRTKRRGSILFNLLFMIILIPLMIRHPYLALFLLSSGRGGGFSGGGFGGGFGGFGGGLSGGGGASRGW